MKSCEMKRLERNRNEWNFLMETGCEGVTLFRVAALRVALGTGLPADAGFSVFLEQLVHPLDDALQRLVHV